MSTQLPTKGFVFWPVGTGDSTTIVVDTDSVLQVDLHHMVKADDDSDPCCPIVDELASALPERDGKPYLAVFALTHPDTDHCAGFADLFKRVTLGELWFSPRIFTEYTKDLGDHAKAFKAEAMRRVKATIEATGDPGSGNRVRIIGYNDLLEEDDFKGFPEDRLTIPGSEVTILDDADLAGEFRAFVHAPFKDGVAAERNESSIGLQVSLYDGEAVGRAMLLGDLCYPTIDRIFEISDDDDVAWHIWLAPHHCSKSVMYWKDEDDEEETLRQDLLDKIEAAAESSGCVVASSSPVPSTNKPGDNPPHAIAKARYEEISPNGFICTMEYPDESNPKPLMFEMTTEGLQQPSAATKQGRGTTAKDLTAGVAGGRGAAEPPKDRVGFGRL
jgi:hypothetical protein